MRRQGVELAGPKVRNGRPVLGVPKNTTTSSPEFDAALSRCNAEVRQILRTTPSGG